MSRRASCAPCARGLTADAIDLDVDEEGTFVQTTPNFGGNILSHIAIPEKRPQMVTVHPRVFEPLEPKPGAQRELIRESVEVEPDADYVVVESRKKQSDGKPIDECDVLVAGGRGIKSEEDLAQLRRLAELLGGELACSRPLCDCGWMPHEEQIGQSGTTVKPKFILNVAISGSVQYLAGMQNAGCIMSINHTASAPIYDVSHYGAVADYRRLIPEIIAEIERQESEIKQKGVPIMSERKFIIPEYGPFAGMRVVCSGSLVAMPFAATMLADFGAEVIQIERPAWATRSVCWRLSPRSTAKRFPQPGRRTPATSWPWPWS